MRSKGERKKRIVVESTIASANNKCNLDTCVRYQAASLLAWYRSVRVICVCVCLQSCCLENKNTNQQQHCSVRRSERVVFSSKNRHQMSAGRCLQHYSVCLTLRAEVTRCWQSGSARSSRKPWWRETELELDSRNVVQCVCVCLCGQICQRDCLWRCIRDHAQAASEL